MKVWPNGLYPIQGCQKLIIMETGRRYKMPIRPLTVVCNEGVKDQNTAQAWYEFAYHNELLSKSEVVACLQRSVILDQHNAGLWYTLGCHYELEGTDWYGATNAFNHVIYLNPDNEAPWYSLASLWHNRGFHEKAQEYYDRFEELYTKRVGERPPQR